MSHDPKECRARAANCLKETSRCIAVKDRDPLHKLAKRWLDLAANIERAL
jgi:hypothetical protein